LFGVDSQISTQRPYPYAAEFNPAPLTLAESAMKLRLRLLHGEDLIRFFNALARQNAGLFLIDECKMQRIDTDAVRFQPNLMAECELSWVTAKPRSGNGEKTVKQLITLASDKEQDAAPVAEILTLGGSVRRSDGKSTVWINNRAINDRDASGGVIVDRLQPNGALSLQVLPSARSIELKVGQNVDMVSGTIEKAYARQVTAPQSAGPESAAGKPAPGKPPAPGEKAAASASMPEQKVLKVQPESGIERLRRTRREGNDSEPDRR
jgi:hypothetical protein